MTDLAQTPSIDAVPVPIWRVAELKVKVRSLAAESRIIRAAARKAIRKRDAARDPAHKEWHESQRAKLEAHRRQDVRGEARASQLALAFLRGHAYRRCEPKVHAGNAPAFIKVAEIAHRFGDR